MKQYFQLLTIVVIVFGVTACGSDIIYNDMTAEELVAEGYVVIAPDENIRIGASVALTGVPIPNFGKDIANGAELAVIDLNEAGGFEGHSFELVVEDGGCNQDSGTIVGHKFAADPTIIAVSGGTCSDETLSLAPILQKARIPFVSPSSARPNVISESCDVCNRVTLGDTLQGEIAANYALNELGVTSIAILHDNSNYGVNIATLFHTTANAKGATVTAFEGVPQGDTDFRPVLITIAEKTPDLIFFGGNATEAGLVAQQMNDAGLGDAFFMSVDEAYTQQYIDAAGGAADGTYISFIANDESAEANAKFDEKYEAEFGSAPDDLGQFHGQSYDSVKLIADAISRAAIVADDYIIIDRETLLTEIRATRDLDGLTGTLSCDAMGECGAGGIQIFRVEEGAFVQVYGFGLE